MSLYRHISACNAHNLQNYQPFIIDEKQIHLIKGENIWDVFADFSNEKIDKAQVFHSWYHTPLVSGSIRYNGSYFKHKARIYYLELEKAKDNRIKIFNNSKFSSVRIWI